VVVFIAIINLLCNLFVKLTKWPLEFEINMLTCNGVDESAILDKFILYHMEFMNKWIDLYDKKERRIVRSKETI
jgi:hypothetical protein